MTNNKLQVSSLYGEMKTNKATKEKKVTVASIIERFQTYNRENKIEYGITSEHPEISAVIVYAQSNFTKEYSETSRSYRVTNQSGKRFFDGMMGNSIYGECLDGSEDGVRLDAYNWKVEKCYFEN